MKKSNAGTHFMDSVFNGLNELKHVENKHSQVEGKHLRISEALTIAQKKMDQCIFSNTCLQKEIDKHKSTEESLREACEFERNSMVEYMDKIKSTCKEIAEDLLQARNSYKEKALMGEISETERILQETKLRIKRDDKELQELNRSIEKLSMEESFDGCSKDVEIMLNGLIRAIEVDKNESEAHLLQLQRELKGVHKALQSSEET